MVALEDPRVDIKAETMREIEWNELNLEKNFDSGRRQTTQETIHG